MNQLEKEIKDVIESLKLDQTSDRLSVKLIPSNLKESAFYKEFKHKSIKPLNLGRITFEAFGFIEELDEHLVGTPSYIGLACFWGNYGYKHTLRPASPRERRMVHNEWIKNGLDFWEESDLHDQIVEKHCQKTLDRIHGAS